LGESRDYDVDKNNASAQALEFTLAKTLVWVQRSLADPADLGPATTIQVLDKPQAAETFHFGDIR
jgi:CRISPR/Cas system-associated endoribonuclease Cas2